MLFGRMNNLVRRAERPHGRFLRHKRRRTLVHPLEPRRKSGIIDGLLSVLSWPADLLRSLRR